MPRRSRITYSSTTPPRVTIRRAPATIGYPAKTRRNGLNISSDGEEIEQVPPPDDGASDARPKVDRDTNVFGENDEPFASDVAPGSMGQSDSDKDG
jgi:hypothetical protein